MFNSSYFLNKSSNNEEADEQNKPEPNKTSTETQPQQLVGGFPLLGLQFTNPSQYPSLNLNLLPQPWLHQPQATPFPALSNISTTNTNPPPFYSPLPLQQSSLQSLQSLQPFPQSNPSKSHQSHQSKPSSKSLSKRPPPVSKSLSPSVSSSPSPLKLCAGGLTGPQLNTPQEIERWVQARKKNYPTRAKINNQTEEPSSPLPMSQLEKRLRKKLRLSDFNPAEERRANRERKEILGRLQGGRPGNRRGNRQAKKDKQKEEPGSEEKTKPEAEQQNEDPSGVSTEVIPPKEEFIPRSNKDHPLKKQKREEKRTQKEKLKDQKPPTSKDLSKSAPKSNTNKSLPEAERESSQAQAEISQDQEAAPQRQWLTSSSIIGHLTERRGEDQALVERFVQRETGPGGRHRHIENTILSSLLLNDVYKERSIILSSIRYICENCY